MKLLASKYPYPQVKDENPQKRTGYLINFFFFFFYLSVGKVLLGIYFQVSQELETQKACCCSPWEGRALVAWASAYGEVYLGPDSAGLVCSPGQTWLWEELSGRADHLGTYLCLI